mgnify:CR=1 FL=1
MPLSSDILVVCVAFMLFVVSSRANCVVSEGCEGAFTDSIERLESSGLA